MAGRMIATVPDQEVPRAAERPPSDDAALVDWVVSGLDHLVERFAASDPETPCRRWRDHTTIGWWLRRQAHETAVHRWDAEAAVSTPSPIDAALAADGVDEWLDFQLVRGYQPPAGVAGSIHLHATDPATDAAAESPDHTGEPIDALPTDAVPADVLPTGEWLIRLDGTLSWEHGHHKGDLAVRGTREQLYLACWGRVGLEQLETFGDTDLWQRLTLPE
jgi:hypothetical protein